MSLDCKYFSCNILTKISLTYQMINVKANLIKNMYMNVMCKEESF